MPGKPVGTIYAELALDTDKYTKAQREILKGASQTALDVEKNWRIIGQKSDIMYDAMRQRIINAYDMIKNKATSSATEIIRAEETKNAKIKALNEQQFGSHKSLTDSISKNWMIASAAVIGAIYAMRQAFDIVKMGAQAKAVEESFNILAKSVKISGDSLIETMKRVTNETIDDSDLMLKANRLMIEGFSSEQIIQIAEASRLAARIMGTDVSAAYNQIADSVVNLRERGLKTAGFVIDLTTAYENHAKKLGVAKDELNEYGKQMAVAQALHEKYIEVAAKMGPLQETETEKIQKMGAAWKNLQERIGQATLSLINFFFTAEGKSKTLPEMFYFLGIPKHTPLGTKTGSMSGKGGYLDVGYEPGPFGMEGPSKESQIKIDEYTKKYGMSEQELKDRLELSRLYRQGLYEQWAIEGNVLKIENEIAQTMADDMFPSLEKVNTMIDQGNKYWIDQNKQLAISKSLIRDMDWESVASGAVQLSSDTERIISQNTLATQKSFDSMQRTQDFVSSIGQNISDVWATNMSKMITDAENFNDAMNNIWKGMADAFVSAIMKMIVNWVLFGNITGQKSAGGGYGGIIGSIVSIIGLLGEGGKLGGSFVPFRQFDIGGIADRPTLGMIAERGQPEAVVPLKGGAIPVQFTGEKKDQGNQNLSAFYIYALDPLSFRDFIRKNPEAIIEAVSKDSRSAGTMRGVIKNNG